MEKRTVKEAEKFAKVTSYCFLVLGKIREMINKWYDFKMSNLTEKERRRNSIKSKIRGCHSDIEDLESEIFDLEFLLAELDD